jgi:hypothetical protein
VIKTLHHTEKNAAPEKNYPIEDAEQISCLTMPCNDHNTLAIGYKDGRIKLHDVHGENTELVIEAGTSGSVSTILMY